MRRRFLPTAIPVLRRLLLLSSAGAAGLGAWGCESPAPEGATRSAAVVEQARGDTLPGAELAAVFGCGACHAGAPPPAAARDHAPALTGLATRWDVAGLVGYLVDPRALREGVLTRMPDFHMDTAEASAVAMHLLREEDSRRVRAALRALAREHPGASADRGAAIVEALNCAGCHGGTGTDVWLPGPPLFSIRDRVRPDWLRRYLTAPTAVRPFGYHPGSGSRMPDFDLSRAEADRLVEWVTDTPLDVAGSDSGSASARSAAPGSAEEGSGDGRAKRLLEDHLACLGCHSLDGAGGRIAPALDEAGTRLRPEYLRRIVHSPERAVPGTMMPAPLADSVTLERIVHWLGQRDGDGVPTPYLSLVDHRPARPPASGSRSPAALYARYCAACHGETGEADGFNAAYLPRAPTSHADSAHMATRPDDTLFDGIHGGGHILGRSHRMPGFGETLTAAEISGLVAHLRELCGCVQPAWAEGS